MVDDIFMDGFCIFDILPGSYIDYFFVIASPTHNIQER